MNVSQVTTASAATNASTLGTNASTFDQIKAGISNTVNWGVRQVQWLISTIKDFACKAINWAKPFFASIANGIKTFFNSTKDFIVANKEAVGASAVVVSLLALAACAGYFFCKSEDKEQTTTTKTTTTTTKAQEPNNTPKKV